MYNRNEMLQGIDARAAWVNLPATHEEDTELLAVLDRCFEDGKRRSMAEKEMRDLYRQAGMHRDADQCTGNIRAIDREQEAVCAERRKVRLKLKATMPVEGL
jgi:hypothetical protein